MRHETLTLTNELGLHARPATSLVRKASRFRSVIKIKCGDKEADAKSILGLLSLGARKGSGIDITVSGPDEEEAFAELCAFLAAGLEEE